MNLMGKGVDVKRGLVAVLICLGFSTVASAQSASVRISQIEKSTFPQVSVYVSMTDANGRPIAGLAQTAFTLTEDDRPGKIDSFQMAASQGMNTILVVDCSGSMSDEGKMTGAKQAAATFVGLMNDQDRTALVAFDTSVRHLVPLTNEKDRLRGALASLNPGSSTALYDAVYEALDEVRPVKGRRAVIALTDGLNNASRRSMDSIIAFAQDNNIPIYAIGLGADVDKDSLSRMADQTGGVYRFAPSAGELDTLYRLIQQQMQGEYVLAYQSPRPVQDGLRRVVQVKVDWQGSNLQASGSYLPGAVMGTEAANPLVFVGLLIPLLFLLALPSLVSLVLSRPPSQPARPVAAVPAGNAPAGAPLPPAPMVSVACPHCGRPMRPAARFCPSCAQPVGAAPVAARARPGSPRCPQCGAPIRAGAKFCGQCRHRLNG